MLIVLYLKAFVGGHISKRSIILIQAIIKESTKSIHYVAMELGVAKEVVTWVAMSPYRRGPKTA